MKSFMVSLLGLVLSVSVGAEPLLKGRVWLASGPPAAGVHVRLFDLTDLRRSVGTTTDEAGHFALPLATVGGPVRPQDFALGPNYPNPFNPSTIIPYQIPTTTHVRLEVFNLLGQRLATLVDGERPAGTHTAHWDATDAAGQAVAAGIYFYRLSGDGGQITRSMVLIDGQAGMPAGSSGGLPLAGAATEAAAVYGLTVSGPGLIPFVDPAFRPATAGVTVELYEASDGMARAKTALSGPCAAGGVVGDVDNNGRVDFFDALLVALYSGDTSTIMPNQGDISRGDVNRDGEIDVTDAYLIASWLTDPSDPSLPAGIGEGGGMGSPDCAALVALYEATDGDNWTNNTHWLSDRPLGEWHGVITDDEGRVIALNLGGNQLSGTIPSALGELTNLQWLSLVQNQLSGALPESLVNLTNLGQLYLHATQLCVPTDDAFQAWLNGIETKSGVENCGDVIAFAEEVADQAYTAGTAIADLVLPEATGGEGDVTYQVFALPAGLAFDAATRTISGTPEAAGVAEVNYLAQDSAGASALTFSITVNPALSFGDLFFDQIDHLEYMVGVAMEPVVFPETTGGTPPITYSMSDLPPGLTFDPATRTLSGTPTTAGTYVVTYIVTDANGAIVLLSIAIVVNPGADPMDDRAVLVALYEATNGDNWENNTHWLSDRPIGEWYGVTTDENGRVTELFLFDNQLSGVIPAQLGNLANLQELTLRKNQLSGVIPAQLSNLANLQDLDLSQNQLRGTISSQLGNLANLRTLNLGNNQLSGSIPAELGNLANLQYLLLHNNQLSGSIPSQLGNLSNLQDLVLSGNQLSGSIPHELGNLTNLTRLSLVENQLSGSIPAELGNLTNLRTLNLFSNQLSGSIPSQLGNLTNLEWLLLNGNQLSGCIPEGLRNVKTNDFSQLGLPFCGEDDEPAAPDSLALVALYHATNGDNWTDNTNWLSDRPIDQWYGVTTDDEGRVIALNLGGNQLSGTIPPELGNLSNLQFLSLTTNIQLSGSIPPELGNLSNLQFLFLGSTQLSGTIPSELGNLSNLQDLWLFNTQLSGSIPPELGNLSNLQALYLANTQLSGCIPEGLRHVERNDFSQLGLPFCGEPVGGDHDYDTDDDGLIEISSLAQLNAIRYDLNGDGSDDSDAYATAFPNAMPGMGCPSSGCAGYELTTNLDFDTNGSGDADAGDAYWNGGAGWVPIGAFDVASSIRAFGATFDGNGYTIANLYIGRSSTDYVGLFGYMVNGGEIRHIGLTSVNVVGNLAVGGLVGRNESIITNSYATGSVIGSDGVGGIVGDNNVFSRIISSYFDGSVFGSSDVGGLVGFQYGPIYNSYTAGIVSGNERIGGLVGRNHFSQIYSSYSNVSVSGNDNVGGLVGEGSGGTTTSYWDTQTSGQSTSAGGEGKTTAELQSPTSNTGIYATWDNDVWDFGTSSEYPRLRGVGPAAPTASTGKMYWTDSIGSKIQRANLDGSEVEDLVTSAQGLVFPVGLALDVAAGKMYWTDDSGTAKIGRANLDGSGVEVLLTQEQQRSLVPHSLALDVAAGKMYWADSQVTKVGRANLDGSGVEVLLTRGPRAVGTRDVALDVAAGKMYWASYGTAKIGRANLDGTGVEDLVTTAQGLVFPNGLALDVAAGKMYWTDSGATKIGRANLDGTGVEDILTREQGLHLNPSGPALDVAAGKIYWGSRNGKKIRRANLDGTGVEDLVVSGLEWPRRLALDTYTELMVDDNYTEGATASLSLPTISQHSHIER